MGRCIYFLCYDCYHQIGKYDCMLSVCMWLWVCVTVCIIWVWQKYFFFYDRHAWKTMFLLAEQFCVMDKLWIGTLPKGGRGISDTYLPPVWNLRAVSLIPLFCISSLVLLPSPVTYPVLLLAHSADLFFTKLPFSERVGSFLWLLSFFSPFFFLSGLTRWTH